MKSKKYLAFFIFIILSISNISYSYSIEPDVFVQSTVNRASKVLSGNFSKEEKIEKLDKMVALLEARLNKLEA